MHERSRLLLRECSRLLLLCPVPALSIWFFSRLSSYCCSLSPHGFFFMQAHSRLSVTAAVRVVPYSIVLAPVSCIIRQPYLVHPTSMVLHPTFAKLITYNPPPPPLSEDINKCSPTPLLDAHHQMPTIRPKGQLFLLLYVVVVVVVLCTRYLVFIYVRTVEWLYSNRVGTDAGCVGCRRVERTVEFEEHTQYHTAVPLL